uniref:hypothetical protein n=1 Tax=Streptomyces lancefieldiae TaxID=3075520 RepID=UPI00374E06C6
MCVRGRQQAQAGRDVGALGGNVDGVVAPVMYRILFRPGLLDAAYARRPVAAPRDAPR